MGPQFNAVPHSVEILSQRDDTQERPVSQLVKFPATRMTLEQAKKEHDEWHPVYIEDCLWCRSEVALPSVRAALQASEEREQRLRALCEERMENGLDTCALCPSDVVAILDGGKP